MLLAEENEGERKNKLVRDMSDIMGEGNLETMLSVEMGLTPAIQFFLTVHFR